MRRNTHTHTHTFSLTHIFERGALACEPLVHEHPAPRLADGAEDEVRVGVVVVDLDVVDGHGAPVVARAEILVLGTVCFELRLDPARAVG